MARKRDTTVKLNLRLPERLHRRLERAAAHRNQSLNSEMIDRLQRSFDYEAIRGLEEDVIGAMRYGMLEMLRLLARGDERAMKALGDAKHEAALRKALHEHDRVRKTEEGENK